ncbi:YDG domain-containing protein [Flavobacterium hauense]
MVKLLHPKILQKLIILLLFLPAVTAWGQTTSTINRGLGVTQNNITGVTVSYNGETSSCSTTANPNASIQMTLTAQTGYSFTINSITGTAVRSSAGRPDFNFQLVNNGTVNGNSVTIPSTSSCGGGTTVPNIIPATANKTVNSGSTATINIVRGGSGGGYSHMKTLNVSVTVTGPSAPVLGGTGTGTFTYGTAGSYTYTLTGSPAPTVSATYNSSTTLPAGITLDAANKQIDVAATVATGTYDIILSASNSQGNATPHDVSLTVNPANQSITNFTDLTRAYGDADFNLTATGGGSGQAVTYVSSNPAVATITGNVVTIVGIGTADITASQAGNSNYNPASDVTRQLTVTKANQTIANFNTMSKVYGDADFTLTATGGASGQPVTYTSSNTNVATVIGDTVTIVGAGTSTITASQDGDANYNATSLGRILTVAKATQTITFTSLTKIYGDADFSLTATGGASAEPVTYTSSNPAVATVSGNTVTITGTGTTNITASQAGDANYNAAANVIRTLTVDAKAITITGLTANNKIYDGDTDATLSGAALTASEIVGSDDVTLGTYTASFSDPLVAYNKAVAITYQLTGAQAGRYILTQPTGVTAAITAKELTINGIQISNKTYDGTTAATITGTPGLVGIVNTDNVTLDAALATAAFTDPNVGPAIPVTVSGYSLTGTAATNYSLQQPQNLTANITSISLQNQTIDFAALANATYGDADFNFTATATSGLTVTYSSSNTSVATVNGTTVTILNPGTTTITANQSGDSSYNPAPAVQQQLIVDTKTLTISNASIADKVYNQTTTAVASGTLSGVINSDNVTLVSAATFTSDNAGNNIPVTAQYSITGTDIAKYRLSQPTVTGNILPVALTVTNAAAANKAYDANTNAVITGILNGILTGDTVTLNGTGTFANENVSNNITVTSTATLSGTDASNYVLTQPTGLTANITTLSLTVNATATDKEYDKTTNAVIAISQINGLVSGDDVTVTGNGTFNNFNVGTAKPVTANLSLTGADALNYTLTQPTGLNASITRKALTVDTTNTTVANKIYDKTTTATLTNVVLTGAVSGDETLITATGGNFIQSTVGNGITVNNLTLSGSAAANYQLTQPTALTGNIVPKQLTLNSAAALNKVYDGTTDATIAGTLAGIANGDNVTLNGSGTFASADVLPIAIAVTSAATLTGTDAANYTLLQPTGLSATITAKALSVTATAFDKVYDSTTTAVINNAQLVTTGIIAGDDVSLAPTVATATFVNATVGNNKNVTAGFTLQGSDASNYSVANQTYQASITPLGLTVDIASATVAPKTYDATTNGAVINGAILNGVLPGDSVNASGSFASANVGTNIPVTLNLTGTSAANYTLTQPAQGLSGEIIKKTLTAKADNKTKTQGAANPALTITYAGFEGGQTAATAAGFVAPSITTTADATSPLGAYPINLSGGWADNYTIDLTNEWLIVTTGTSTPSMLLGWTFYNFNSPATRDANIKNANLDSSRTLSRGPNAISSTGTNSFRTVGFKNDGIAVTNTDYFEFTVSSGDGYQVTLSSIAASCKGTVAFGASPGIANQFAYSTDGTNFTLIGTPSVTISDSNGEAAFTVDLTGVAALQNVQPNTDVKFRFYASGRTTTGGWGFFSPTQNDYGLSVYGAVIPAPAAPQITSTLAASSYVGESEMYQIAATGTPAITLSATNLPTGATVDANGLITFDGTTPAGIYNINLKATGYYGADNKVLVYTINKENQFLTFTPDPLPGKFANDVPFTVSVANSAPLAVIYSSSDTNVATIAQDGTITIVGAGTTTITASNTGNAMYNAVSLGKVLTVLPTPQITATPASISFTAVQGQGASATVQLTALDGINLIPAAGNITLTASTGFEISMGIGAYGSTANFAYTGGAFSQVMPQIFVRFAAGQAVGTYNGTLTISGGTATLQIPLSAIVDPAPAINTTAVAFGPYCSGSTNNISLTYTTQGTFAAGTYYVQHSDASGIFPGDFSNIISASSTVSPIAATLPSTLVAGNYRVRVIHLSSGLVLTSSINDNGSDIVINTTAAPTATPLTFCNNATVTNLTATGTALKWYAAANGGSQLASTDVVTTGNYFVSQTLNDCESTRTQVAVTVNITPAPTATALTFCNNTTVTNLTATGTELKWYAAAIGGSQLASTDVVTTGNYFVSQTLNDCESTRTQVAVTVNITPAPTATALTFCNNATVTNLTATTGTDLKWYAAANGGSQLASTDVVTTGNYFVSQTLNDCESTRTQVAVTVNVTPAPTATALTFCNNATVTNLTATTGTDLKWYAAANGGSQLASTDVVTTGNYFVSQTLNDCESTRTQVAVTVNVTPAPTGSPLIFINNATVAELTASGTNLKWYSAANGGSQLSNTTTLTSGSYFVSQTLNDCESARTEIVVTITIIEPAPPAPIANDLEFCAGATVTDLDAEGTELKWYDISTGEITLSPNTILETGNYYVSQTVNGVESDKTEIHVLVKVTPLPTASAITLCKLGFAADLTATGTDLKWYTTENGDTEITENISLSTGNYYVSQTLNGCESARAQVPVTINVTPAPLATNLIVCPGSTIADLSAEGTDLKWYTDLISDTVFSPETVVTPGNYYVSQTLNECESARTLVLVDLSTVALPIAENQTFCEGSTIGDLALMVTGDDLKIYTGPSDSIALDNTIVMTTGNYYVSQTVNGCESQRTEVFVTIHTTVAPTGNAEQVFEGEGHTLAELETEGEAIKWYASEEDAIAGIDSLPETTLLIADTTYYATQTTEGCESKSVLAVTVTVTLGQDEIEKFTFRYFPNPVTDNLQIVSEEAITHVKVFSLTGQLVMDKNMNAQTETVNMSHLESGVYIVKISFGDIEKTIRIVREK